MQTGRRVPSTDRKAAFRRGLAAACCVILGFYALSMVLRARGSASARSTIEAVYTLVSAGDYTALGRDHLASASAVQTLKEAERVHGKLTHWRLISSDTHLVGRPTQSEVMVTRNSRDYVDVLALGDSVHLHIVMELDVADWKAGQYERAIRIIAKPPDPKRP